MAVQHQRDAVMFVLYNTHAPTRTRVRAHTHTHTKCLRFTPVVIPISIRVTMPLCCAISCVISVPEELETDCVFTNYPLTMETETL